MLYSEQLDSEFWAGVKSGAAYKDAIDILKAHYAEWAEKPLTVLSFSARFRYYRDGERADFEKPFFGRRILLSSAAILSLIYPENEEYLHTAEELIWAICDEYCWAVAAHTSGELSDDSKIIDLFTAETAAALAEITAFLEKRLNKATVCRVKAELERRVFEPFRSNSYFWEHGNNNWSAVCAGGVGIALMYSDKKAAEEFMPRLIGAVNSCLASYTSDGTCLEGFTYWNYGFGYFVYFADMLYRFTDGRIDMFDNAHVQKTASYPQRSLMRGNSAVSFADAGENDKAQGELIHYLHRRYPETAALLPENRIKFPELNCRWCSYLRYFAWVDPEVKGESEPEGTYLLPDAGQYITARRTYSFAVKAGNNDEPHNHNDIGEFIIATDRGQELCDLGAGRYTRDYFNEHRYEVFCNSSISHSVPIINGKTQSAGRRFSGSLSLNGDTVTLDIGGAYDIGSISVSRRFELTDTAVTLTDSFSGGIEAFTERFVSEIKPAVEGNRVKFGLCSLRFDSDKMNPVISEQQYAARSLEPQAVFKTAYCVDFPVNPKDGGAEFVFETE